MGFVTKKLQLSSDVEIVNEPLIKREWLEDCVSADKLLRLAEKEFMNAIGEAKQQCELISDTARDEAQGAVWQQANELLARWEEDHQELCQSIEPMAGDLVTQSLTKIFGHMSEPEQISSLVHQLAVEAREKKQAVLKVHPNRESLVLEELEKRSFSHWKVESSQHLNEDELVLNDEDGQYSVSLSLSLQRLKRLCS